MFCIFDMVSSCFVSATTHKKPFFCFALKVKSWNKNWMKIEKKKLRTKKITCEKYYLQIKKNLDKVIYHRIMWGERVVFSNNKKEIRTFHRIFSQFIFRNAKSSSRAMQIVSELQVFSYVISFVFAKCEMWEENLTFFLHSHLNLMFSSFLFYF